ncbi:restriction endonuclease subunit S [Vibrio harveyi]|nr:restriction endonuclease subunit S [Vibrio harveyi]
MRSHYKRIGDYVTQIKLKNTNDSISSLKGININKHFMPSVANINGTDLSKYRVVKKNQFAFNPMHVGRDEVLPISMLEDDEPIIVSPAYVVFEVKDEEELLPAYLMMWCRRSEFDRNAWFMTDNSVRGGFSWADFCDMELPVPSIEKQREIVREYNVVNDRIALNEQLTQKLEDTVQALYKRWFVDFEFPISKEYAQSIGKSELEGKPYKSSGGEMEYSEKIEQDIPSLFEAVELDDVISNFVSNRGKSKSRMYLQSYGKPYTYPVISAMNIKANSLVKLDTVSYVDQEDFDDWMPEPLCKGDLIMTSEAPLGELMYIPDECNFVLSQRLFGLKPIKEMKASYLYCAMQNQMFKRELEGRASGTTALGIRLSELKKCYLIKPSKVELTAFDSLVHKLLAHRRCLDLQNIELSSLKALLLTRISKV